MKRVLYFAYGVFCYLMFLGIFFYTCGWLANLGVPRSIDSSPTAPTAWAITINVLLLGIFALQHSIMARPTFKRWWTQIVPKPIERSTYVLCTNLVLILLFWQWRSIDTVIWDVQSTAGQAVLWGMFGLGWATVFVSTVLLNHFDLFGLRQVWLYLRGKPYTYLPFNTPLFYQWMRHPLYLGWALAFWCTPTMTGGHLLFAFVTTMYMLVAIQFEERNLIEHHGSLYAEYRRAVPMMIPLPGRRFVHRAVDETIPVGETVRAQ
jgi:methanethiol S-methyltransferase